MCTFDTFTNKIEHTELEIVRHIEKVRGWQDKMVLMEEEGRVRVVSKGGDVLREMTHFEEGCDIYDVGVHNDFAYFATNKGIYRCDLADKESVPEIYVVDTCIFSLIITGDKELLYSEINESGKSSIHKV